MYGAGELSCWWVSGWVGGQVVDRLTRSDWVHCAIAYHSLAISIFVAVSMAGHTECPGTVVGGWTGDRVSVDGIPLIVRSGPFLFSFSPLSISPPLSLADSNPISSYQPNKHSRTIIFIYYRQNRNDLLSYCIPPSFLFARQLV